MLLKSPAAGGILYVCTTPWCNGSTSGFGPFSPGSNPGGVAKPLLGYCPPVLPLAPALRRLTLEDAYTHVAGMTANMKKKDVAFLRETVAGVEREAAMTGMTSRQVTAELLTRLESRPEGFKFVDAGNRVWDSKAYCEMLARTTLLNTSRQEYLNTCAENDADVVCVTVSGHCCEKCAVWENRLLSISGKTKGLPTVDDAIAEGLFHPNCTHSLSEVDDYTREEEYNPDGTPKTGEGNKGDEHDDHDTKPLTLGEPFKGISSLENPNIKELQDYIQRQWGVSEVNLSGLDPGIVQQASSGLEKLDASNPGLNLLKNLRAVRAREKDAFGVAPHFSSGVLDGYTLLIGKGFASPGMREQLAARIADFVKAGNLPKGASIETMLFHEAGHMRDLTQSVAMYAKEQGISYAEACKEKNILDLVGWHSNIGTIYARSILDKAQKEYMLRHGRRISVVEIAAGISKNACDNCFELISEAMHDVGINGKNAHEASKIIADAMGLKI